MTEEQAPGMDNPSPTQLDTVQPSPANIVEFKALLERWVVSVPTQCTQELEAWAEKHLK